MPELANPKMLWLLLLLIPYYAYYFLITKKKEVRIPFSRLKMLKSVAKHNSILRFLPIVLKTLILLSIIIALARPRLSFKKQSIKGNGIDIVMAIDVSGSMLAEDFKPKNRLEAAKKIAQDFVKKRKNDRISIVEFADHAFTKTPLTLDYNMVLNTLDKLEVIENAQGTAIGMGLASAAARLKDSTAKSKIIILLTDGRNNTGSVNPLDAAEIAKTLGIKVYTIGVGKKGLAPYPQQVQDPFTGKISTRYRKIKVDVDMETLNEIAKICGTNRARRAHNTAELEEILKLINQYEKTEFKIKNYYVYDELFQYFIFIAIFLLALELTFKTIIKKKLP